MAKVNKTKLKNAIIGSKGFVTLIAKRAGVSRQQIYNLLKKWPDCQELLEDEREGNLDVVETKLMEQILAGNTTATIFYLKTQGKSRGYVERVEQAHSFTQDDVAEFTTGLSSTIRQVIKEHIQDEQQAQIILQQIAKRTEGL